MQDHPPPCGDGWNNVAREGNVDERRLRLDETRERARIRLLDDRMIERRRERIRGGAIALRRRLPVERDACGPSGDHVLGEAGQAGIDHRE